MVLTLDIQKKAEPIIRQTNMGLGMGRSDASPNLSEDISDLILTVEGFDHHIAALSKQAIKELLDDTNKVITIFVGVDEQAAANSTADKEVQERFQYALKALYKLKSLLHLAYTRDVTPEKTPASIKEGLAAVSRAAVNNSFFRQGYAN